MDVFHFARRHLRIDARHAFTCSLIVAVGGKMFGSGGYLVVMLQSAYHFDTQFGNEIGRFTVDFLITSPALVAAYIEDGGVDVGVAQHTGFPSGDKSDLAD